MQQSFLENPRQVVMRETPVPSPLAGEVLVKIGRAGICGSDLHLYRHGHGLPAPLTLGHEAVGVIEEVGQGVSPARLGQRVVIEPNLPCGHCPECRRNRGSVCRNKRILGVREGGCFAEYFALPEAFAHPLPQGISEEDAVAIEPATVALAALGRAALHPGDALAVIGLGAIGMLLCHVALAQGYTVLATDPLEAKRQKAAGLGARICLPGPAEVLEGQFASAGVTAVFECAGAPGTASLAVAAAPHGADIVLLGLSEEPARFVPRMLARKGNRIIPSLIYEHPHDFKACIDLVERGVICPGFVVEKTFPFGQLPEALDTADSSAFIKVTVRMKNPQPA